MHDLPRRIAHPVMLARYDIVTAEELPDRILAHRPEAELPEVSLPRRRW